MNKPKNNQEAFEIALEGMMAQRRCSYLPNSLSGGAYRGVGGTKCSVGFLIPDELYYEDMEGRSIDELLGKKTLNIRLEEIPGKNEHSAELMEFFENVDLELLSCLQRHHDRSAIDLMYFEDIASKFGLMIPEKYQ